jgi:hypothetical protein
MGLTNIDVETILTVMPEFIDTDDLPEASMREVATLVHRMFAGEIAIDLPLNATWLIANIIARFSGDGSAEHEALRRSTLWALGIARDGLMELWAHRQRAVGNSPPQEE